MRNLVASQYTEKLLDKVVTPFIPENYKSVWAQYSVLTESSEHREKIQKILQTQGIPTAIYYPKPLHLQMAFNELEHRKGDFQVSESVSDRILSLPMHPYLSESDIDKITRLI
jgi:dTDP-4-amino-4,6-dideoxygalactose transaminase